MTNYQDIAGTSEEKYQIGLEGIHIKNSNGVGQIRDADDSALARLQVAAPVDNNDVVDFLTFKTKKGNVIVKGQVDTSVAIPNNTATERFLLVTTPGNGAVSGSLLYDSGSGSGAMTIIAPDDGRTIFTTEAFTGGNIEVVGNAVYGWDSVGDVWVLQSTVGDATGAQRVIVYNVGTAATTDSAEEIPQNAVVFRREVQITAVYPPGTELLLGNEDDDDLLMASNSTPKRVRPNKVGTYVVTSAVGWGANQRKVRTTLTNTPGSGACVVRVFYAVPNG